MQQHAAASPPGLASGRCFVQHRTPGLLLFSLGVLLAAGLLFWAYWRSAMALEAVLGLALLLFLWRWVRLAVLGRPLLCVGPAGLMAEAWGGHTVAWSDVADLEARALGRQLLLDVALRPGSDGAVNTESRWRGGTRRSLSVWQLPPLQAREAAQAVNHCFERHAGERSRFLHAERKQAERAEDVFLQGLQRHTPSAWGLHLVMALNIGVWLANLVDGMDPIRAAPADLFHWGAGSASAVVRDGEVWRLLSATVLHGGLLHLGLNMAALWDAGRQVCRWYGNAQFLLIYLGAALTGSALSLHFAAQQSVSVGASGAVFGVLGALMVGVWRHRNRVPPSLARHLLTTQGAFVLITLVQGLLQRGIDNAAHVGGLLAGVAMAGLLIDLVDRQTSAAMRRLRQWLATGVMALAVGSLVWTAPAGVDHRTLFEAQAVLRDVFPQFQAAERALQSDAKAQQEGRLSELQLIEAMEQRHIPAYRAVGDAIARLRPATPLPELDDLRWLQSGVLELMTLEVGLVRGTVDPQPAVQRRKVVQAQLAEVSLRMRARNSAE